MMKILRSVKKVYDRAEETFIVGMLSVSVIIIFYQVIMRYLLNNSPTWTEELARFLFIWMSWLGVSLTQKKESHICIELMTARLRGKKLAATLLLADIVTIFICAVLVRYGYVVMEVVMKTKQTSGALKFPMWVVYVSCPVACLLMILRLFGDIKRQMTALLGKDKGAVI